jgi:hypothetical protein
MNGAAILLVTATLGVDFGWKSLPDDEVEYIIQIEPALLESLENGEPIHSELLPEVRGNVRRFRIQIGNAPLPREAVMRRLRPRTGDVADAQPPAKQAAHEAPAIAAPKLDEGPRPKPPEPERVAADDSPPRSGGTEVLKVVNAPAVESEQKKSIEASASAPVPGGSSQWLIGGAVALFVSLGANLYLGWLLATIRRNYHQLVDTVYARNTASGSA